MNGLVGFFPFWLLGFDLFLHEITVGEQLMLVVAAKGLHLLFISRDIPVWLPLYGTWIGCTGVTGFCASIP